MRRFWIYRIWNHKILDDFSTIMRMDTDSCFEIDANPALPRMPNPSKHVYVVNKANHPAYTAKGLFELTKDFMNFKGIFELTKDFMNRHNITPRNGPLWESILDWRKKKNGLPSFYNNFEITKVDFFRQPIVMEFQLAVSEKEPFGVFRKAWGDAPVRCMTLALFSEPDEIAWEYNTGYRHAAECEDLINKERETKEEEERQAQATFTATLDAAVKKENDFSVDASTEVAFRESLGFFDDLKLSEWMRLKERVKAVQPNTCSYCNRGTYAPAWFQSNYEPDFTCQHERRIGALGDGGKWVCDPHRLASPSKKSCLVYSVGSSNDFTFEMGLKKEIGSECEIHTFDPDDYNAGAKAAGVIYHQWGLDGKSYKDESGKQFKTLKETVEELGHVGQIVDIFKIDCEGCELKTFESWFNSGVTVQQVLVEVHGGQRVPIPLMPNFFRGMYRNHYVITHKEPNIHHIQAGMSIEYAFLRLNATFFEGMDIEKTNQPLAG